MFKEFKTFISRGNVIDLAVGVIIGGAFSKIVASLVGDVIMPVIGVVLGGVKFDQLKIILKKGTGEVPDVAILYGKFIQTFVDFIILAFIIFLMVKFINKLRHKEEVSKKPEPVVVPKTELLLEEIRDLLKK